MAVSNKFSRSCRKSPKQKPVLSEGFVNYLQTDSHHYRELRNLKMREYNYPFISSTYWPEDMSILASTHKPKDTRMWGCQDTNKLIWTEYMRVWGCKYTSKHTWIWRYEDVKMQGYKQAHMNLRMWGCKDARIEANTYEPEDMRMWGCKDTSKHTWTWGCEDARMRG